MNSLLDDLASWLRSPHVEVSVCPAPEYQELQRKCAALQLELDRVRSLYYAECELNLRLSDLLDLHGVPWR